MSARFLTAFVLAFLVALGLLGGAGYGVTLMTERTPREPFRAALFEFDLARGWSCDLEETEYVCRPPGNAPFGAIAIMTMKERNGDDNLPAYEAHLRGELAKVSNPDDAELARQYIRRRRLAGREWVEALLLGSEVPNYDTYYLATNTADAAILVTMSVHKGHRDEYIRALDEMMATLNVYQR